jgi:hypothetical protein
MFVFPAHLFNPAAIRAHPDVKLVSGGRSINDVEDTVLADGGGQWVIRYVGINLNTAIKERAWNAWLSYLPGQVALVPLVSLRTAPRPEFNRQPVRAPGLWWDDDLFPTEVRRATPYIVAEVSADAALRDTVLGLTVTQGAPLVGGENFSIGERAYRVVRPLGSGTFQISPPLREAVLSGTEVNFDWPSVKAKIRPGDYAPEIMYARAGEVSIEFEEVTL